MRARLMPLIHEGCEREPVSLKPWNGFLEPKYPFGWACQECDGVLLKCDATPSRDLLDACCARCGHYAGEVEFSTAAEQEVTE